MGLTLFKRPVARKENADSEFAATVASLPPGVEAAVPLPGALDGSSPDSLPPDSQPFDSQPFDSLPFDSQLPSDSLPPDSLPPDSQSAADGAAPKAPPGPFDPHPAQELPPFLGGPAPKSSTAQSGGRLDESSLPMADQPTIAQVGRYALKRHLGLGGLGQVHEAWDPLLSRTVAIKTLQFESDPRTRGSLDRLFLNEARAVAGLSHPNIVTVYDAGLSPQGVYLAMERLQGRDLRQRLSEGWKPGPAVAAQLVRRVADALAYAHARGVVHCDIKPGNIFITGSDKPKVLDFGIARVAHRRAIPALEGMVAGSPHYLAPEQLLGKDVDARTDVYSLGVVFYELLSGRRAFGGDSVEQITTAVLTNHPAPAHLIRSGVPESLSAIAARAMARDPEARYANASELSADIRNWFDQPRAVVSPREARAEARRVKQASPGATGPRRWPWAVAGASVALLGIVALGLLLLLGPLGKPPAAGAAATPSGSGSPNASSNAAQGLSAPAGMAGTGGREGELMMSGGVPVTGAAQGGRAGAETSGSAGTSTASAGASAASASAATASLGATAAAALATATTPTAASTDAKPTAGASRTQRVAATTSAATPGAGNAREAAARRNGATAAPASATGAAPATGVVQLAISPWGHVEVNGQGAGTTPPLTQLSLPAGSHVITVRNADFPPFTTTVQVQGDKPVQVKHRFGQ